MSRVRKVEIANFRSIQSFNWTPKPGINCLLGPGDTGKSTILEAIDLCLGARRNVQMSDRDFYGLNVTSPIRIALTLGDLRDSFKVLENYGLFLRAFNPVTGELLSEPQAGMETVITIQLLVNSDLEPVWSLYSERAAAQQQTKILTWSDRLKLSCTKLGAFGDYNFSWRRGSILNRLSEERMDVSAELAKVGREARKAFGDSAKAQVSDTLKIVQEAAIDLGVSVGELTALLDAQSVSFTGGTICLHDGQGIPLHGLGLGSTRLLLTGLQRIAAAQGAIVIIDELEHGLEPHRIMRLLRSLGAKDTPAPLQVFLTTHSPTAVCELSAEQLLVLRRLKQKHELCVVGEDVQDTIRACPGALLASSVIVGEGSSEIGLLRGIDLYLSNRNKTHTSLPAHGVALADGNGDNTFRRALAIRGLGYKTLVLRDNDKSPKDEEVGKFLSAGGTVVKWREGRALEQELFYSLPQGAVIALLNYAIEKRGRDLIEEHIKTASNNTLNIEKCQSSGHAHHTRTILGNAAQSKKNPWFKSLTDMERIGCSVVGPELPNADKDFRNVVEQVFAWAADGKG